MVDADNTWVMKTCWRDSIYRDDDADKENIEDDENYEMMRTTRWREFWTYFIQLEVEFRDDDEMTRTRWQGYARNLAKVCGLTVSNLRLDSRRSPAAESAHFLKHSNWAKLTFLKHSNLGRNKHFLALKMFGKWGLTVCRLSDLFLRWELIPKGSVNG